MIAYLRGRVAATTAETVIIDVNGVGYEAYCSGSAFAKIGNGDTAELYTYLQVREDGMTLFGFSSLKEKELFLKLISCVGRRPENGNRHFVRTQRRRGRVRRRDGRRQTPERRKGAGEKRRPKKSFSNCTERFPRRKS